MIPPISVTPNTFRYTLDALLWRVRDLDQVLTDLYRAASALQQTAFPTMDIERVGISTELDCLIGDIRNVRDDLGGVIATIEPAESARATLSTGAPWPLVRTFTEWAIEHTERVDSSNQFVPIVCTSTAGIDHAPATLADRVARLPHGTSRVRIERFDTVAGPRFEVYLAGTDFTHGPDDPWWAGANAELWATGRSRSVAATEAAFREAGITGSTPIVITGHSQGGAIALALAESHRYRIDAIFTVGAPTGLVPQVTGIPIVHVVHPEDPVPALGGEISETTGTSWVVHPEPRVMGVDAHRTDVYRQSVVRIDRMGDPSLGQLERHLYSDGPGTAMWFRATTSE